MTFTFDRNYDNNEQVRPYYPAYVEVRAELTRAGKFNFNSEFKGRIPGIEGDSEDAAIYLLQTMHDLDALAVKVAKFIESGAVHAKDLDWSGQTRRGTVVSYGFYMGGTGWSRWDDARLTSVGSSLVVTEKGKRTGNYLSGRVLYLAKGAKRAAVAA